MLWISPRPGQTTRRVACLARPPSRSLGRAIACRGSFLLGDRVMIGRMPQYAPDTIDDVHLALRGLSHRMEVEVEPGIPLAAHTVADLRARATWPPGLQLIVPDSLFVP